MNVLITGANGFIGQNLCAHLESKGIYNVLKYNRQSNPELLDRYTKTCDFVFHLAGVNRPQNILDYEINHKFTLELIEKLKGSNNKSPILMSSSIQAEYDNPYGNSKRKAEDLLFKYEKETGTPIYIFRLPGVFGKWCKPNYNSVVATFCHNIAHNLPIHIEDPNATLSLVYIDDILKTFTNVLQDNYEKCNNFCKVEPTYHTNVAELANKIKSIQEKRPNLLVENPENTFNKKLYSTYLSYLPEDKFSYKLNMLTDYRGTFAECLKSPLAGQVSINITKPGMTKGKHWHHTKTEKLIVVGGKGIIRFQKLGGGKIITYPVSCENIEVVDIPPGYVHDMTNTGENEMIMIVWANQIFDPEHPDTYPSTIIEE